MTSVSVSGFCRLSSGTVKFLFWQFALYALTAFALGFVAAWSWLRERLRGVETALERTQARVVDGQEARHQLLEARSMATVATESLVILRERIAESDTIRVAAEAEVEFLRSGRLKLLSEISELRAALDTATVSRTRVSAAEHEATRLRGLLDDADVQIRTERVAREQTLSILKSRLANVEAELASFRFAPSVVREVVLPPLSTVSGARRVLHELDMNGLKTNGSGSGIELSGVELSGVELSGVELSVYTEGSATIVDLRSGTAVMQPSRE